MIILELDKEDIEYVDRISELADMSIVIDNPKSFSSELNTEIEGDEEKVLEVAKRLIEQKQEEKAQKILSELLSEE